VSLDNGTGKFKSISGKISPTTAKYSRRPAPYRAIFPSESANAQRRERHLSLAMKLNWKSVKAAHVARACEAVLNSAGAEPKPGGLIVIYKDKRLPAKTILRIAYCLANDIPSETKLKFASSEGSFQFLRSLGFQAERFPVAEKDYN
jgi:hypothetical protein